jgi:hypothetical protein
MRATNFDFMKKNLLIISTVMALALTPAFAQFGPHAGAPGPSFGGATSKLFGDNQSFTAALEFQTSGGNGGDITMPGKISFDGGKARFEMNMSEMKGSQMPASAAEHLKAMGMDTMVSISRPDTKRVYLVYPGLNSYAEMTPQDTSDSASPDDFKSETEKLGTETVDGHDCVKNKVTMTDKDGNKHVSTVWNATDLKNFPVKIVTAEQGNNATMLFKNVSFAKPAASAFEPPTGFTKYDNVQTMMQTEMMKKMGGLGVPPQQN